MNRRTLVILLPVLCFLLIATSLYLGGDHLTRLSEAYLPFHQDEAPLTSRPPSTPTAASTSTSKTSTSLQLIGASTTPTPVPSAVTSSTPSISDGTILSAERISPYVSAILDPAATVLPRLECPALDTSRYDVLRQHGEETDHEERIDYFFALNLRECVDILPRLMGSIVEAIRYLGPRRCALSIVEGNSPDGTSDVLAALQPFLQDIGVAYFYNNSKINPSQGSRIHKLAQLRNLALGPLYKKDVDVTDDTTVVFINDVAACTEDILELVLQRGKLNADMTCAMDWVYVGDNPTFYDIWIARTIEGDSFFEVGSDGNWNSAWNLFWNAPQTRSRYDSHLPFQVFSCWNGATTFTAAPLLHGLRFRDVHGDKDECFQGEPQLFCKDMWFRGYRKIAVIPTVNLEYSNERGADIKKLKGYVSDMVKEQEEDSEHIEWIFDAPKEVRCMPNWENQTWRPWNETLR